MEPQSSITYARVVSRKIVCIALTMEELNNLDVFTSDIKNAHLQAPVTKKIWTVCGHEFGVDSGKQSIVFRALYGLKSSGFAFRNHLSQCMSDLGYYSCKAYPDVWMRACTNPDRTDFYEYIILYVDDILCMSKNSRKVIGIIDKFFLMQPY